MAGNTPDYQFFIKDHLGSTRVVATAFGQVLSPWYEHQATMGVNWLERLSPRQSRGGVSHPRLPLLVPGDNGKYTRYSPEKFKIHKKSQEITKLFENA